jgi:hypothetical protein
MADLFIDPWLDAWRSSPSICVVEAGSAADVFAAVRFAGAHKICDWSSKVAATATSASNAPDSLLVWTRPCVSPAQRPPGLLCGFGRQSFDDRDTWQQIGR